MTKYFRMYLAMYTAFVAVVALVYALTGFHSTLELLVPGPLAAVVGVSYAKDHHQTPSNRERVHFAVRAALLSSLVVAGIVAVGVAWQGSGGASASAFVTTLATLVLLNAVMIYVGLGLGAWGALRRIEHPKAITFSGLPED